MAAAKTTADTQARIALENQPLTPRISALILRIESEYREMPGLTLTEAQARRLWDLDGNTCRLVLTTLLRRRFLQRTTNGTYVRVAG